MARLEDGGRLLIVGSPDRVEEIGSAAPSVVVEAAPEGGHLELAGTDALVAGWPAARPALEQIEAASDIPVVWCVPRETPKTELQRLTDREHSQLLFEPCAPGDILEAARTLLDRASAGVEPADPMAELWDRFRGSMIERQRTLEDVGAELLEGTTTPARVEEAHQAAQELHDALGTYGLTRGSELAASVDELLEGDLDAGARFRMSELIVALRREIGRGRQKAQPREADGSAGDLGRPPLLIVERDRETADELMAAASAGGWRPMRAASLEEALPLIERTRPRLAILDPEGASPSRLEATLRDLAVGEPAVPVVFYSRLTRLSDRLRAVSLGARAFVRKPASPEAVLGRAAALVEDGAAGEETILAVDDDPSTLHLITAILRGEGFRVRTLESAHEFWNTLEAVQPDIILLDVEMPKINGFQLCRVVRADPRWATAPVVFLTGRKDQQALVRGFEAGADDFITKPIVPQELIARVANLAERLKLRRRLRTVDTKTGLTSHVGAMGRLEVQLALAERYDEVVSAAIVRIEGVEGESLAEAMGVIARALRRDLRGEDVLASWDSAELMVSRYGTSAGETRSWLDKVAGARPEVELHVGVAEFPGFEDAERLAQAASDGLAAARKGVRTGSETGATAAADEVDVDIIIVEADESLGTLLVGTLEERGFTTRWIRDGLEADRLLTGRHPGIKGDVILLDAGLPGLDGLTLLRRLSRDGIARRSRILMLTARSAETEVVRALELGAFDHVPKPFSVSELVHRVRRASRRSDR